MNKQLLSFLIIYLITRNAFSQNYLQIGPNTGNQAISSVAPIHAVPYNYNSFSAHIQFVYTASELIAGGTPGACSLDSIGWYVINQITGPMKNYTIKMKNTSASNAATYDASTLQTVYGPQTLLPATDSGWYMQKLGIPFNWDGVSNLLVDVCWGLNTTSSASGTIRHFSTSANLDERIFIKGGSTALCGTACNDAELFKPWVRFYYTSSVGLNEIQNLEIKVRTNSSPGIFDIEFSHELNGKTFEVFDIYGRRVITGTLDNSNSVIDISREAKGIYILNSSGIRIKFLNW